MAPSLFSINNYMLSLWSPPPTATESLYLSAILQGTTKVNVNYNQLNFNVKPFKVILNWPGQDRVALNDAYIFDAYTDSLSTYSPLNSAFSYTVIAPQSIQPANTTSTITIYYENGFIHTFYVTFLIYSDNVIDMDLNVLDIQNTNQSFGTVFNLQSNRDNVVYNNTDIIENYFGNTQAAEGFEVFP